jgi:arginyl-tRNA synthetase
VTPADVSAAVVAAVRAEVDAGELSVEVPQQVTIERPKHKEHGDYATNVALQLARPAGRAPREVAELLARRLREVAAFESVDVAGPGFLNLRLSPGAQGELARTIVTAGDDYGRSDALAKQKVNLEFVSANPTGPVHLGHTRWAALGDSLHRLLEAAGADVTSEHYINDAGVQMQRFAESLAAAAHGEPSPPDGYAGEYIDELARQLVEADPSLVELDRAAAVPRFLELGYEAQLQQM